ncbi:MAG TPA: hypothetical protein VLF17_01190 [Candidatus Nitrosotenuis sp.]|nr:hypothetical protein [Candidatus Nitrosotenuis sp.]
MDKYLLVILIMLVVGMGFAIMKSPPSLELFYGQLAGALIIIAYSTIKNRRTVPRAKKRR